MTHTELIDKMSKRIDEELLVFVLMGNLESAALASAAGTSLAALAMGLEEGNPDVAMEQLENFLKILKEG